MSNDETYTPYTLRQVAAMDAGCSEEHLAGLLLTIAQHYTQIGWLAAVEQCPGDTGEGHAQPPPATLDDEIPWPPGGGGE